MDSCCSFLSSWSQVFNAPAESLRTNQINLTCLCLLSFVIQDLNSIKSQKGNEKGLNVTFHYNMTLLGPTTSVFTTQPVPLRFKVICCLWNMAEMIFFPFWFILKRTWKQRVWWSVADICSFSPSVVVDCTADCLDACDESWEIRVPSRLSNRPLFHSHLRP